MDFYKATLMIFIAVYISTGHAKDPWEKQLAESKEDPNSWNEEVSFVYLFPLRCVNFIFFDLFQPREHQF